MTKENINGWSIEKKRIHWKLRTRSKDNNEKKTKREICTEHEKEEMSAVALWVVHTYDAIRIAS